MIGATSADISFFSARNKDEAFAAFGPADSAARQAYDPDGSAPIAQLIAQMGADRYMIDPARSAARAFAGAGLAACQHYAADSDELLDTGEQGAKSHAGKLI